MRKLLLLFLCTIVPAVVSAQRLDVTGRVLVKDTGKPIGQAVVELPQSGLWAVADADGNFTVKGVPAGETRFVVSCLGFVTTEAEVDVRTGMGPVRLYAPEDNLKRRGDGQGGAQRHGYVAYDRRQCHRPPANGQCVGHLGTAAGWQNG